tara:strand:- start:7503 stop:7811 length:309 start_codon:yes stop_codon:yes gene_type:complete
MTVNVEPGKCILSAILAIDANAVCTVKNEDIDDIEWTTTPIAKDDILAKVTELETAYNNLEYARKRKAEYPAMEEQLDKIYNDGIDAWKADIKAIKDKYPKG